MHGPLIKVQSKYKVTTSKVNTVVILKFFFLNFIYKSNIIHYQ